MFMEVIMKTLKTLLVSFLTIFSLFSLNASQDVPPLIKAIAETNINTVNKILAEDDFPNKLAPLHFAFKATNKLSTNKKSTEFKKSLEIIKLLIDAGAKENALNRHGQTPLDVAIKDCKQYGKHLAFMLLDSYKSDEESTLHKIVSAANNYFALKDLESVHFLAMLTRDILDEKAREMLRRNTRTKETPTNLASKADNKIFKPLFQEYLPKAQQELHMIQLKTPVKVNVPPLLKRVNGQMVPAVTEMPEYDTLASLQESLRKQSMSKHNPALESSLESSTDDNRQSIYGTAKDLQINPTSSTGWSAGYETFSSQPHATAAKKTNYSNDPFGYGTTKINPLYDDLETNETSSDASCYDTLDKKVPLNDSGCLIAEDTYLMPGKKVDTLKEKARRETLQRGATMPANFNPYNKPN